MKNIEKFRIIIQLALADNQFEETERNFISDLAKLNGISNEELDELLQEEMAKKGSPTEFQVPSDFQTKLEILADMTRIMKVDGKVYLSEIKFCEMIAKMFGFKEKAVGLLAGMVHNDPMAPTNWSKLEYRMRKLVV